MITIHYIYLYLLTVPIFFIIDMLWLGVVAKGFYQSQLSNFLGDVNWTVAVLFYLVYIVGILIFAVVPALNANSFLQAVIFGILFGFFAYATYDLTNLATLKDWPLLITFVDIIWGAILTGTVSALSFLIGRSLFF